MKKLITVIQEGEIAKLATEGHYDALIAYGADMYRDGIRTGAFIAMAFCTAVIVGNIIAVSVKKNKDNKQK